MNSIYVRLLDVNRQIAAHVANNPREASRRTWRLAYIMSGVLLDAGPVEYGPELPPVDVHRWQMTEEEWAGMTTPGVGT